MKRTFLRLIFGVNITVAGLFLAGFLAAYADPSFYWMGAILAVGLPFLAVALLPFALFHAVGKRWVWLAVHVLFVFAEVNRHWSIDRVSRPDAMKQDRTLMTFNAPRHPDTDEAMKHVNALILATRPDMIGLQESIVWATKRDPSDLQAHAKFRMVVDSMGYATVPPRYGPERASWVRWVQPLLSLYPIESQEQLTFSRQIPGWPELDVLRSVFAMNGRRVVHFNVHLFTYGPSKPWNGDGDWLQPERWVQFLSEARMAFRVRAWQAKRIRELIDNEPLPFILSGDFNGTADNWTYHHLARGLQDAFRVAGEGWGGTYHSRYPFLRIDFVLLGPEFEAVRASVPSEYPTESDHRPLVVRFRWKDTD